MFEISYISIKTLSKLVLLAIVKMKLTKKQNEKLAEIYFDVNSSAGFSGPETVYKKAKKTMPSLKKSSVEYFFTTKEIPSRFRKTRNKFRRTVFIVRKPRHQFGMDLADLRSLAKFNKNFGWICVIQDLFTRQLISLTPQKTKTSVETAKSIESAFVNNPPPPKIIYSDKGTEFEGKARSIYDKFNVKHDVTMDFTQKVATTERAILYIKRRIYKIMSNEKNYKWVELLPSIQKAYNDTYNRSLKMTPNEAALPKNQSRVFYNTVTLKENLNRDKKLGKKEKFSVGDFVRIRLDNSMFSKTYTGAYSQVLYVITERKINSGLPVYYLKEFLSGEEILGLFYPEEMVHANIDGIERAPKIEKILGFRMNNDQEEVRIQVKGSKEKIWVPYSNLIQT